MCILHNELALYLCYMQNFPFLIDKKILGEYNKEQDL